DGVVYLQCKTEQGRYVTGGLLNIATAIAAGVTDTGRDCIEPKLPKIEKAAEGATQSSTDADQWSVSYLLTVTPQGTDTYYDLGDQPGFPTGVNLVSGTAQRI